ncbi:LOW QUALITY PROTEIN: EF-hand calcium-binding domain-containing protein 8 [Pluvialis apricaria]
MALDYWWDASPNGRMTSVQQDFGADALLGNWCHQIEFIPELKLVASCSAADKRATMLTLIVDGWISSLVPSELLSSGHLKNISHILYIKSLRLIITSAATAASDCGSCQGDR